MTVQELITELQQYPPDAQVIYNFQSDFAVLEPGEVQLVDVASRRLVLRDGRYHRYEPHHWPKDWVPQFVNVVLFPGN